MRDLLSVNQSNINNKFFIMNNTNGSNGKPKGMVKELGYFDTLKDATIAMFKSDAGINIYDMNQKDYEHLTSNR